MDISEFVMPGITLNEEMIEEELHMSTEMEVLRMDNIDLGDRGKILWSSCARSIHEDVYDLSQNTER